MVYARRQRYPRWGSVTFVQRFGSSLNLNPHVHVLMLDGVYVDGDEAPVFVAAPPLSDQTVRQIVETSARRIIRLCTKRGLLDDTAADPLADEEPVLAALTAASVRGLIATGARAGQRLRRALRDPATGVRTAPLCFASRGFSLHAATRIAGPDPARTRTLVPLRGQAAPGLGRMAGCVLNAPSGPELIRIRADRQPEWTPSSVEGRANDPPGAA